MNIDGGNCWDSSMLAANITDAIKAMQLAQKEGEKAKEQKEKSLNVGVKEEFRDEKRLLDLKA